VFGCFALAFRIVERDFLAPQVRQHCPAMRPGRIQAVIDRELGVAGLLIRAESGLGLLALGADPCALRRHRIVVLRMAGGCCEQHEEEREQLDHVRRVSTMRCSSARNSARLHLVQP
jgi:hypothetical protein